ncbi:unnamed protein product [Sphagnum tenellum]
MRHDILTTSYISSSFCVSLSSSFQTLEMRLIAAESDRAYNGGPLDGKYYQHSSFTPLEAGLVQVGIDFLMEEYTFRLSVLYFKDLGQLDKSVGELLPSRIEGLVQDGHLQNAHASLLQALHGAYPAYALTVNSKWSSLLSSDWLPKGLGCWEAWTRILRWEIGRWQNWWGSTLAFLLTRTP